MNLSFQKPAMIALLFAWQALSHPAAAPEHLRYERAIQLPGSAIPAIGQACVVLDAEVFAHAAPSLKDLRIYSQTTEAGRPEVPYAVTLSESLQQDSEEARILNLGSRAGKVVFDLEMPKRPYTNVNLDLAAQDFIATAEVSGSELPSGDNATRLGSFTLFDLSSQHLSHSTALPLAESSLPYLHVELSLTPAPGTTASAAALNRPSIVKSAAVPPSREAQTIYTALQQVTMTQRGRQSIATFQVPTRVPVERVAFVLAPGYKGNFSRSVEITARVVPRSKSESADSSDSSGGDEGPLADETVSGNILRVHESEAGHDISDESLSVPTAIGSNMQRPATVEVAIDNGDDAPLPIAVVQLQMRQRRICFSAANISAPLALYYGDAAIEAPVYDYAKLFQPVAAPLAVTMSEEALNPGFTHRAESRPFTERHPELLWIVLLGVIAVLAVTAIHSAKKLPR